MRDVTRPPWHPDALADRAPFLRRRSRLLADTRAFFSARGLQEVETPVLQRSAGMEPGLDPFRTRLRSRLGDSDVALELRFSPEFAIKKLLAGGIGPCFELARVFRNGESGTRHSPEFTMLEWYRPGFGLAELMDETEALLRFVSPEGLRAGGRNVPVSPPFARLRMEDAFGQFGIDLMATLDDAEALAEQARRVGLSPGPEDTWQDSFLRILLDRIEPSLGSDRPVFLTHWPASEAALARLDPDDPRVALRFELFVSGIELANAYVELSDPVEQRRRFAAWAEQARTAGSEARGWDDEFLAALEWGLPDCAGIALGFDRLAMLVSGADRIEQVLWLPLDA